MYIGEGVPYVHAVLLPPRHRFDALLGTPPLQKRGKKVIFGAKILSSIFLKNLKYFLNSGPFFEKK